MRPTGHEHIQAPVGMDRDGRVVQQCHGDTYQADALRHPVRPVGPAHLGLGPAPHHPVRAAHHQLQPIVGVEGQRRVAVQATAGRAEGVPARPWAAAGGLAQVPHPAAGVDHEHLDPAVGTSGGRHRPGDQHARGRAGRQPLRPAAIGRRLLHPPQLPVGHEQDQAAVGGGRHPGPAKPAPGMVGGGRGKVIQPDQPLLGAVCQVCCSPSAAATNSPRRPSSPAATVAGHDPPGHGPPRSSHPDQSVKPPANLVCQRCHNAPPTSNTNTSSRPSAVAATAGAPISLGMVDGLLCGASRSHARTLPRPQASDQTVSPRNGVAGCAS
jgi:hypothetical protein